MTIATIVPENYYAPWGYVKSLAKAKEYKFDYEIGNSIVDNRNRLIARANDDLLFIDGDIIFDTKDLREINIDLYTYDIIAGICMLNENETNVFDKDLKTIFKKDIQDRIFEVGACGMGFTAISIRVIKKIGLNPFDIIDGNGEDVSFCLRAKKMGFKVWCNPFIKLGHIRHDKLLCF